MGKPIELGELSIADLLRLSRGVVAELRKRRVLRTANAPAGDYAEYLVARAYRRELAPSSEKSWDVRSADGRKLQVKSRVDLARPGTKFFSPFRSFDFDAAVFILFDPDDLSVQRAVEVPMTVVQAHCIYRRHVNGCVAKDENRGSRRGADRGCDGGTAICDRLRAGRRDACDTIRSSWRSRCVTYSAHLTATRGKESDG